MTVIPIRIEGGWMAYLMENGRLFNGLYFKTYTEAINRPARYVG